MVTCWRRNAKSTLGRAGTVRRRRRLDRSRRRLYGGVAVVTTFSAGKSRLWPTAFSLAAAVARRSAGGVDVDD